MGTRFVRALYRLTQTAKIHDDSNKLLIECAKEFGDAVAQWCTEEEDLKIQISHGRFFLQDDKLYYPREAAKLMRGMYQYFETLGLQGLRLYADLKDAPLDQILGFARLLNRAEREKDPLAWLVTQQETEAFPSWVEILHGPEEGTQDQSLERKKIARKTYAHGLSSLEEVSRKITARGRGRAGVRKLKRIVQNMVDLLMEDESVILGMSTMRNYDDYTYTHSVNVSILSLCLGKRIGLSRVSLRTLGICGLVHDLGKVEIPRDILNKPGKLSDLEFREIEKHPLGSVRQIIKLRASRDLKARILLPPFEHHLKYDLSGYPRVNRRKPVSLFGRILAIADVFDAMTSPRKYRPTAISPDRALGLMQDGAGKEFDPILLKVFVNMLGVYPVGTLVQLDTGAMGLVMETPEDTDRTRPRVMLLVSDGQGGFKKGKTVNLAEQNPKTGAFLRNIKQTFNPVTFGIQPADFLVSTEN